MYTVIMFDFLCFEVTFSIKGTKYSDLNLISLLELEKFLLIKRSTASGVYLNTRIRPMNKNLKSGKKFITFYYDHQTLLFLVTNFLYLYQLIAKIDLVLMEQVWEVF